MSLNIFTDPSCNSLSTTISDPFNAYRQCSQDTLLIYPSPIVASCELASVDMKLAVKVGLCPGTLDAHTIVKVRLEEGCRMIGSSPKLDYYINQGCNETGFRVFMLDPTRNTTNPEPEQFTFVGMSMTTLVALGVLFGVLVFIVCCSCCVLKRLREKKANERFKRIVRGM
jgi:hypothetical protein